MVCAWIQPVELPGHLGGIARREHGQPIESGAKELQLMWPSAAGGWERSVQQRPWSPCSHHIGHCSCGGLHSCYHYCSGCCHDHSYCHCLVTWAGAGLQGAPWSTFCPGPQFDTHSGVMCFLTQAIHCYPEILVQSPINGASRKIVKLDVKTPHCGISTPKLLVKYTNCQLWKIYFISSLNFCSLIF